MTLNEFLFFACVFIQTAILVALGYVSYLHDWQPRLEGMAWWEYALMVLWVFLWWPMSQLLH